MLHRFSCKTVGVRFFFVGRSIFLFRSIYGYYKIASMTNAATNEGSSVSDSKRILAIWGSKGGVGSSMIATNLGIFLAQIGKRVLLVDADVNNGSLHVWLGLKQPSRCVGEVLFEDAPIEKNAVATPYAGLYLLAGVANLQGSDALTRVQIDRFWHQLEGVDADFIILDLPSSLTDFSLSLFCRANDSIMVTLPLPDSVETTYRFMIAAWLHKLSMTGVGQNEEIQRQIAQAKKNSGKPIPPRKLIEIFETLNADTAETAREISTSFHPQLIVNQVKIKEDEYLGDSMVSASARWLGANPILLGTLGWDDNVWLSLRRGKVLLSDFARSRACKDLEQIVRKLMSLEYKAKLAPTKIPPATTEQNYYELLEIFPGASEEEIRRAYKQIRNWFGLEGMAVRGAATDAERAEFERLAEQAHAKLLDRSERRSYDKNKFPNGFNATDEEIKQRESIAGVVAATHESLPRVTLTEDDFVDGEFLGCIRKKHNVELVDISNRAKVSVRYLRAIEEERFADLPAPVFTRGFVTEFARFLKIDPRRATADFMSKYEKFVHQKK